MKLWNSEQINRYAMGVYDDYKSLTDASLNIDDSQTQKANASDWKHLALQTDVNMRHPRRVVKRFQQQLSRANNSKLNNKLSHKDLDTIDYLGNQSNDIADNLKHKNQKRVQKHLLLLNQKLSTSNLDSVEPIYKHPLQQTVNELNHAYINSASLKPFKAPANIVKDGYLKNLVSEEMGENNSPAQVHKELIKNSNQSIKTQQTQEKYIDKSLKSYLRGDKEQAYHNKSIADRVNTKQPKGTDSPRLKGLYDAYFVRTKQIPTKDDPKNAIEKNYVIADQPYFDKAISQAPKSIQAMAKNYKKVRQHHLHQAQQNARRTQGQKRIDWLKKAFKGINEKHHSDTHNLKKNNTLHTNQRHTNGNNITKAQAKTLKQNQGREI